jgi:uncharacterized phage-associated protein/DNA-binding transcriptional regulator YiaG
MNSPFTGGKVQLKKKEHKLYYRKEEFTIMYHYVVCDDTENEFTTDELDSLNITQVHNQYRSKYAIPFIDEIKDIRQKYNLSAIKMSEVLGLGANIYRNYEAGEMPSVATGRLIRIAQDPEEFLKLIQLSKNVFEPAEFERLEKKIQHTLSGWEQVNEHVEEWLFGSKLPGIYNGYRVPSLKKIGNMVRYFAHEVEPFTTALNKLMFYSDFGHFKKYGYSISGISYKAIQKGPVPSNYGGIYNQLVNEGYVKVVEKGFENFVGEQFLHKGKVDLKESFSDAEIETLSLVAQRFKRLSTKEIVKISHEEQAWKKNAEDFGKISYVYGFKLIAI